jgi:TIR domain
MGFADELLAALEIRNFKVLIDRRDLPYGEELNPEIIDFIRGSDAVVFVVSPRSVRSAWCKWEVEQVKSESKRLVPIVLTPVPVDLLPTEISDVNLLLFDDAADFEQGTAIAMRPPVGSTLALPADLVEAARDYARAAHAQRTQAA